MKKGPTITIIMVKTLSPLNWLQNSVKYIEADKIFNSFDKNKLTDLILSKNVDAVLDQILSIIFKFKVNTCVITHVISPIRALRIATSIQVFHVEINYAGVIP